MPLIMSRRIVLCATACRPVRQKTRLPTLAWICRPIPPRPYAVTRSCSRPVRSGRSRLRAASPRQAMRPQAYLQVCRSPRHHRPAATRISRQWHQTAALSGACSLARRGRTPITPATKHQDNVRSLASTWAWTWAWTWALT
ncbi:hypothetical protein BC831DRAFT_491495 [Entophlyctis helioformis]|nr:hypothetical protein BC831DRAFT_491495 [Entophlyctis helioformis]